MQVSAELQSFELAALEAAWRPISCQSCHTRCAPRTGVSKVGEMGLRMRQCEQEKRIARMREHLGHNADTMGSACLTCLRLVSPLFLPPSTSTSSAACFSWAASCPCRSQKLALGHA